MAVHRIRLHGFWTVTPLPDGGIRHARRFGRPRALDPGVISHRRQVARLALEGRYRPQSSEDRLKKQKGRTQ